jgi:hypothetical protein
MKCWKCNGEIKYNAIQTQSVKMCTCNDNKEDYTIIDLEGAYAVVIRKEKDKTIILPELSKEKSKRMSIKVDDGVIKITVVPPSKETVK